MFANRLTNGKRTVILGAGPTGLGAANRLQELGYDNYVVLERNSSAGGLSSSYTDEAGFTWDIGGHVLFSHYQYFDELMDGLLGAQWLRHERDSWIWIRERFVPYPFQNNIRYLPDREMRECLSGLIDARRLPWDGPPANFEEWLQRSFGEGISRHFMLPYNFKVWAHPPRDLAYRWIGERVAEVDLKRVVFNILDQRDSVGWGPNNTFRFPLHGGTGEIWRRLAARLSGEKVLFNKTVTRVDTRRRVVQCDDGSMENYDILVSTIPLDLLIRVADLASLLDAAFHLRYSTTHVVGVGLKGSPPPHLARKCWMYFPEDTTPFYRATVFSNYSPNNVPDASKFWSLMLEVSESPLKPVDRGRLIQSVIGGLSAARLIEDPGHIVDTWYHRATHGYPVPTQGRDDALGRILPALEDLCIFSRGRFGAWKYEVGNQDHSLMQGVELVNRLVDGAEEQTLGRPGLVNRTRESALPRA
jgi:protoporphyrinogen oxidase